MNRPSPIAQSDHNLYEGLIDIWNQLPRNPSGIFLPLLPERVLHQLILRAQPLPDSIDDEDRERERNSAKELCCRAGQQVSVYPSVRGNADEAQADEREVQPRVTGVSHPCIRAMRDKGVAFSKGNLICEEATECSK